MTEEACYYHSFEEKGVAKIYNPDIKKVWRYLLIPNHSRVLQSGK